MKALNLENIRHFFTASVSAGLLIVFGIVLFIPDSAKAATRSDVKRIIVAGTLEAPDAVKQSAQKAVEEAARVAAIF